jgi:non-canonical purine NTP pyrophosphatase (RdgB/HAM1 family)
MQKLVIATGNQGKLHELQTLLTGYAFELITQKSLNISDADETGLTFVENALIKARHAATISGLPALADDSGLCVDVMNGGPGIYSARYAGAGAKDSTNNEKLLHDLLPFRGQQLRSKPSLYACWFFCVMPMTRYQLFAKAFGMGKFWLLNVANTVLAMTLYFGCLSVAVVVPN